MATPLWANIDAEICKDELIFSSVIKTFLSAFKYRGSLVKLTPCRFWGKFEGNGEMK